MIILFLIAKAALIVGALGFMTAGWAVAKAGDTMLGLGYCAIALANLAFAVAIGR